MVEWNDVFNFIYIYPINRGGQVRIFMNGIIKYIPWIAYGLYVHKYSHAHIREQTTRRKYIRMVNA